MSRRPSQNPADPTDAPLIITSDVQPTYTFEPDNKQALISLLLTIVPRSEKAALETIQQNLGSHGALNTNDFLNDSTIKFARKFIEQEKLKLLSKQSDKAHSWSPAYWSAGILALTALITVPTLCFTLISDIQSFGDDITQAGMAASAFLDPLFPSFQDIPTMCATSNQTAGKTAYFNIDTAPQANTPTLHGIPILNKGFFQYFKCFFKENPHPTPLSAGTLTAELHTFYGSNTDATKYFNGIGFPIKNATLEVSEFGITMSKAATTVIAELLPFAASIPNGLFSASLNAFTQGLQSFGENFKSEAMIVTTAYTVYAIATVACLIGLALYQGFSYWNGKNDKEYLGSLNEAHSLFQAIKQRDAGQLSQHSLNADARGRATQPEYRI